MRVHSIPRPFAAWFVLFSISALCALPLAVAQTPEPSSPVAALRFDGAYKDEARNAYLKFFEDGSVAVMSFGDKPEQVAMYTQVKAFAIGIQGRYQLKGDTLEFQYTSYGQKWRGRGRVEGTRIHLEFVPPEKNARPNSAVYAFVAAPPPIPDRPLGEPRVRFDGAYEYPDPYFDGGSYYLRFFEDGYVAIEQSSRGSADSIARRDRDGFPEIYVVPIRDVNGIAEFEISYPGGKERYKAKIGTERMQVSVLRNGFKEWQDRKYYEFVPMRAPEPPLESIPINELVDVRVGSATLDEGCEAPAFQPGDGTYAQGTTEIAYEVTIHPRVAPSMDVRVDLEVACPTAVSRNTACNTYSIIGGRPVVTKATVIVTCDEQKPFRPGSYVLRLLAGQPPAPVKEMKVTVR